MSGVSVSRLVRSIMTRSLPPALRSGSTGCVASKLGRRSCRGLVFLSLGSFPASGRLRGRSSSRSRRCTGPRRCPASAPLFWSGLTERFCVSMRRCTRFACWLSGFTASRCPRRTGRPCVWWCLGSMASRASSRSFGSRFRKPGLRRHGIRWPLPNTASTRMSTRALTIPGGVSALSGAWAGVGCSVCSTREFRRCLSTVMRRKSPDFTPAWISPCTCDETAHCARSRSCEARADCCSLCSPFRP